MTCDEDLFILSAMNLANFLFSSTVVRINETFNNYTVVSDGTINRNLRKLLEISEDNKCMQEGSHVFCIELV